MGGDSGPSLLRPGALGGRPVSDGMPIPLSLPHDDSGSCRHGVRQTPAQVIIGRTFRKSRCPTRTTSASSILFLNCGLQDNCRHPESRAQQWGEQMAASLDQTEALKLISDWCKWLITLETTAVGVVAALAKQDSEFTSSWWTRWGCGIAVVCFVCSIVVAAAISSNIPTSVQDVKPGEKIWDRWIYVVNKAVCRMHFAANLLFGLFVIGVAAFASSVLALITRR
jgi:hypothetical protein